MTEKADPAWSPKDMEDWAKQQAQSIRDAASDGGLRFHAYLPPALALWLLDRIEDGTFVDPSEAVFVLFKQARELEPHLDLQQDLLHRQILSAVNDPRPSISADELQARVKAAREKLPPDPAVWQTKPGI
jgi:antitoxin ParD1/3/4